MSVAQVFSCTPLGLDAVVVCVEVHLSAGLPGLTLVGLPEAAVRESKDRVRSALMQSGFQFPSQRITINLSPADFPKEGGRFDLAIALGILIASGQLDGQRFQRHLILGELSLGGRLQRVRGVLSAALAAERLGYTLLIPYDNHAEAALVVGTTLWCAQALSDVIADPPHRFPVPIPETEPLDSSSETPDLAEVRGQPLACRALVVAAAGGHSLLMTGPPGSGKTLLARCLTGLLPPLTPTQQIEVTGLYDLLGPCVQPRRHPPCRMPHPFTSTAALLGTWQRGGVRPGELSLAHLGVLFLDELPEFNRQVLESLRIPLEAGEVVLARAQGEVRLPARFQLIAAMNPCPCGLAGLPEQACRCTPEQIHRYQSRLSGPLLDRLDVRIRVLPVPLRTLSEHTPQTMTHSADWRPEIAAIRQTQLSRQGCLNAHLDGNGLLATLSPAVAALGLQLAEAQHLSARAYHRLLRVARTVADLDHQTHVERSHLIEAMGLRGQDGQPL